MLNPEEFAAIANSVLKGTYKPHIIKTTGDHNKPGMLEIREVAGWHFLGEFPESLLDNKNPNEFEVWREWKNRNYQPITVAPLAQSVNELIRIVTDNTVWEVDPESTDYYVSDKVWNKQTFLEWFRNDILKIQLGVDPNSYYVPIPKWKRVVNESGEVTFEIVEGDDGFPVIDHWIVDSVQVIDDYNGVLIFKDYQESDQFKGGDVFWFVTPNQTIRLEQTAAYDWEYQPIFVNETGVSLYQIMGGIKERRREKYIYRSFFGSYFPFANDVVLEYSDTKVVRKTMAYPIAEIYERECDMCKGAGYITTESKLNGEVRKDGCRKCGNTGVVSWPYAGAVISKPRPSTMTPENQVGLEEIKFHYPPTEALESLDKNWQNALERAKEALNQRFIQEAQSGVAKEADREGNYSNIQAFGQYVYGTLMTNIILFNEIIRWGEGFENAVYPSVRIPKDYSLRTESSITNDLKELRDAETDNNYYKAKEKELVRSGFANNPQVQKKLIIGMDINPLSGMDAEVINMGLTNGSILKEDAAKNNYVTNFMDESVSDDPERLDAWTLEQWRNAFDEWIKNKITTAPILNLPNGNT